MHILRTQRSKLRDDTHKLAPRARDNFEGAFFLFGFYLDLISSRWIALDRAGSRWIALDRAGSHDRGRWCSVVFGCGAPFRSPTPSEVSCLL